jgi:hypothetical protein
MRSMRVPSPRYKHFERAATLIADYFEEQCGMHDVDDVFLRRLASVLDGTASRKYVEDPEDILLNLEMLLEDSYER